MSRMRGLQSQAFVFNFFYNNYSVYNTNRHKRQTHKALSVLKVIT